MQYFAKVRKDQDHHSSETWKQELVQGPQLGGGKAQPISLCESYTDHWENMALLRED